MKISKRELDRIMNEMENHREELMRRLNQIEATVAGQGVSADGVVIAPADLEWLMTLARAYLGEDA